MTGPEHYREAERLFTEGWHIGTEPDVMARDIARAQVHATLALAAATALSHVGEMIVPDHDAWCDVASAKPATPDRAS